MNEKNYFQLITSTFLLMVFLSVELYAASPYEKNFYAAFSNRDMGKWENNIRAIERSKSVDTMVEKIDLINYYYGLIAYLIGKKEYDKAELYIPKGQKLIDEVLAESPNNATAYAFKGSFVGFEGAIHSYKTLILAIETRNYLNKALRLDPNNIQALIDRGSLYFYAPGILGGDKKEALRLYQKAAAIFETNNATNKNWVYLNLLTMIATTYKSLNQLEDARLTYEKVLKIDSNIVWVKNDVYPKLLNNIKNKELANESTNE